ncbi:MAG: hypothetical protein IJW18_00795 [Lachnospiraceae bacterium]|nr:hypothetical protein [Lachnospiraceae bacterium]
MARSKQYKFSDKEQTTGGVASIVFAIVALIAFVVGVIISYKTGGEGGMIIGLMGFCSLWFAGIGLFQGVKSFKQEECYYHCSWIGSIANAVILVFMGCIFMIGL